MKSRLETVIPKKEVEKWKFPIVATADDGIVVFFLEEGRGLILVSDKNNYHKVGFIDDDFTLLDDPESGWKVLPEINITFINEML